MRSSQIENTGSGGFFDLARRGARQPRSRRDRLVRSGKRACLRVQRLPVPALLFECTRDTPLFFFFFSLDFFLFSARTPPPFFSTGWSVPRRPRPRSSRVPRPRPPGTADTCAAHTHPPLERPAERLRENAQRALKNQTSNLASPSFARRARSRSRFFLRKKTGEELGFLSSRARARVAATEICF